jgi:hypothetical protein
MSIEKMAAVLHHSTTSGSTKLVLIGIANHDGDGGAWCSTTTLARYANIERRQVKKILRELEELGELITVPRTGLTNLYAVNVQCPDLCDRTFQHRIGGGVVEDTGVPQDTGGGVVQDTRGVSHRTPEPNITKQITNTPNSDFEKFWELYPRPVNRVSAAKVFERLEPNEIGSLMLFLRHYIEKGLPAEERYIPHPTTWLNRRPWHDLHVKRETERERRERDGAEVRKRIEDRENNREPVPECIHNAFPLSCPQCREQTRLGVEWEQLVKQPTEKEK